ncbi:hypothetical protein [Actinobacillus equuli]|nr:hypothetical protein [Actinobacillus equuli]WGE60427.1 hypothetical protein NYR74_06765 [Actinobacillus equuli subsp. haemolyticus]
MKQAVDFRQNFAKNFKKMTACSSFIIGYNGLIFILTREHYD